MLRFKKIVAFLVCDVVEFDFDGSRTEEHVRTKLVLHRNVCVINSPVELPSELFACEYRGMTAGRILGSQYNPMCGSYMSMSFSATLPGSLCRMSCFP